MQLKLLIDFRMEIYREVTKVLEQLFEQGSAVALSELAGTGSSSSPTNGTSNPSQDVPCLSPADANHQVL